MKIDPGQIRKILVIQLRAIGDVVLTTAVLPLLKKQFPGAEIHFLTGPGVAGLLAELPEIDRLLIYFHSPGSIKGMLSHIFKIRGENYDVVIDYQSTPGTALLAGLSGAAWRLGWPRRGRNWAYNLTSTANRLQEYVAVQKCRALEEIGIQEISTQTKIALSQQDIDEVNAYFKQHGIEHGRLKVNFTPKGKRQARQWFPEKIARLTDMLVEKYDAEVFFNWAPGEKSYAERTAAMVQTRCHVLPGWHLPVFAAFLSRVDLHFSYDNGPKHLATAAGTPTLCLYATDPPVLWNPQNDPVHPYLESSVPCRHCGLRECNLMACMKEIEPEHVLWKIEQIPALKEKLEHTAEGAVRSSIPMSNNLSGNEQAKRSDKNRSVSINREPLNILELCFSRSAGGLEIYMANISYYLAEKGHRVFGAAPPDSFLHQRLKKNNIPLLSLTSRWHYLNYNAARKLAGFIKDNSIDLIHVHQSKDLSTAILAKKLAGRGKVVFTQQMESSREKKDLFHRWVFSNLDGLITITERIKGQVLRNTHILPERVFRLYYGIDLQKFRPDASRQVSARAAYGIADDETVVGILGRLEEGKGQHILLQAMALLPPGISKWKVMVIGGETVGQSGYLNRLKEQAAKADLAGKIIFTGFQENVPQVAAALDIVVLATKKETFGLSLIECMAQNIAPIGTNAGGVPEIINDGENGFLVPPLDAAALSKAVELLMTDRELREQYAERAREAVIRKFDLSLHLANLEKIFYLVIGS